MPKILKYFFCDPQKDLNPPKNSSFKIGAVNLTTYRKNDTTRKTQKALIIQCSMSNSRTSSFDNLFDTQSYSLTTNQAPSAACCSQEKEMVEKNGRRMRNCTLAAIFLSVDFGYMRTAKETDVRGKYMSKNSSVWAWVGSRIQCRWTLRVMGSWQKLLFQLIYIVFDQETTLWSLDSTHYYYFY